MVSAVVLAYNRCSEVLITIEKLKKYALLCSFKLSIIVVDNGSSDDTSERITTLYPDVKLITKKVNNGIAGWNEGFAVCTDKYMLVLDDDSHVENGLTEAIAHLESNPEIGILALNIKDKELQDDVHLDPADAWKDGQQIVGFIGCGALIRREVYEKVGGFSEWLFVYTHEFDFAIRCLNAGYQVEFFKRCVVVHRASGINRSTKRIITFSTRNELGIIHKYFDAHQLKYSYRIVLNNLKNIKKNGLKSGYYVLLGVFEYLKIRNTLTLTPVSRQTQNFYAENFWSTKPVFQKLKNKLLQKLT